MRYFELGVSILPPRLADDANSKIQIIIQTATSRRDIFKIRDVRPLPRALAWPLVPLLLLLLLLLPPRQSSDNTCSSFNRSRCDLSVPSSYSSPLLDLSPILHLGASMVSFVCVCSLRLAWRGPAACCVTLPASHSRRKSTDFL